MQVDGVCQSEQVREFVKRARDDQRTGAGSFRLLHLLVELRDDVWVRRVGVQNMAAHFGVTKRTVSAWLSDLVVHRYIKRKHLGLGEKDVYKLLLAPRTVTKNAPAPDRKRSSSTSTPVLDQPYLEGKPPSVDRRSTEASPPSNTTEIDTEADCLSAASTGITERSRVPDAMEELLRWDAPLGAAMEELADRLGDGFDVDAAVLSSLFHIKIVDRGGPTTVGFLERVEAFVGEGLITHEKTHAQLEEAIQAGLKQDATLHPERLRNAELYRAVFQAYYSRGETDEA